MTTTTLGVRAADVFMRAVELPPHERGPYLDGACGHDAALRAEVEALLAADSDLTHAGPARRGADALVGERVGRYRLLRLLGSGGMGAVYEAEQESPRRSVAVKIVRPGLAAGPALKRFAYESQILARLRHPAIAQIYEAGECCVPGRPTGAEPVPFFAMEFVEDARTLTEYSVAERLPLRARLELVAAVCDGVQHGHQKGVIHRDLKPGNILVDRSGRPKIIDFGVARTTDADIAAVTLDTSASRIVGTLRYMSPEQCGGDPGAIDTRSDVYALGVVLFELLTGRLPHDLETRSIYEAPRIIREEPPRRPSSFDRALRGDLETIILKALEKDRERRYASAAGLAADIRRFLASEPISARPASGLYQLRMFSRRNRGLVGGVITAFIALAIGLAWAVRQTLRAEAALERTERQAYVAGISAADGAIRADDGGTATARLREAPERLRGWEWRLLSSLADRSIGGWRIPGARVPRAIASPDGTRILADDGPEDCAMRDAATAAVIWRCPDLVLPVSSFSPDGRYVTLTKRHTPLLSVRDAATGAEAGRIELPDASVFATSMHPDGRRLAVASRSNVFIYDWSSGAVLHAFEPAPAWVLDVQFSPDGGLLAYHEGTRLLLRESDTGRIVHEWAEPGPIDPDQTPVIRFSLDASILAQGRGAEIRLWDTGSGSLRAVLKGHTQLVRSLAFSQDGAALASTGPDRSIRIWDVGAGRTELTLLGHAAGVQSVAFLGPGRRLVTASGDGTVRIWDASAPAPARVLAGREKACGCVSFASSGEHLLLMSGNRAMLWDLSTAFPTLDVTLGELQPSFIYPGALSPDGGCIAVGAPGPTVRLMDASGGELWARGMERGLRVDSLCFSPDGSCVAALSNEGLLQIRSARTGELVDQHETGWGGNMPGVAFSPDGRWIGFATDDGIRLTATRGAEKARDVPLPSWPQAFSFSPDGHWVAVGLEDGSVVVWGLEERRVVAGASGMRAVNSIAFSPDGLRLAVGSADRFVHVWETKTWSELLTLRGHTGVVGSLAWSRDGSMLASAAWDGTARVWDAGPAPR